MPEPDPPTATERSPLPVLAYSEPRPTDPAGEPPEGHWTNFVLAAVAGGVAVACYAGWMDDRRGFVPSWGKLLTAAAVSGVVGYVGLAASIWTCRLAWHLRGRRLDFRPPWHFGLTGLAHALVAGSMFLRPQVPAETEGTMGAVVLAASLLAVPLAAPAWLLCWGGRARRA